jgi:hypothetical protein
MAPLLSACLIVKNEAANLGRCLASLAPVVDEIVVVDTGSTDDTVAIAHGAPKTRVVEAAWTDDFAAARNLSLEAAEGAWILVVDADEELLAPPAGFVERLESSPDDGFLVRVRNLQPAGALVTHDEQPTVRLFRRRVDLRFRGRIHEQIAPAIRDAGGTIGTSPLVIVHHGYVADVVQGDRSRRARNLALLEQELEAHPDDPYLYFQLGITLKADEPELAQAALTHALALGGEAAPPHLRDQLHMKLAQLALERGQLGACVEHAVASLSLDGENVVSRVCLITALVSGGLREDARPHLEWMVAHARSRVPNPDDFVALLRHCRSAP